MTVQEVPLEIVAVVPVRAHAEAAVSATTEYGAAVVRVKVTGVGEPVDGLFVRVTLCGGLGAAPLSANVNDDGDTVGT